jgi:hypothetical protein
MDAINSSSSITQSEWNINRNDYAARLEFDELFRDLVMGQLTTLLLLATSRLYQKQLRNCLSRYADNASLLLQENTDASLEDELRSLKR